jgi:hypothetical protein
MKRRELGADGLWEGWEEAAMAVGSGMAVDEEGYIA